MSKAPLPSKEGNSLGSDWHGMDTFDTTIDHRPTSSNADKGILKSIMDLWRYYKFLRFAKKQLKKDRFQEYTQIKNAYRTKHHMNEGKLVDLWDELLDEKYVMVMNSNNLRITSQGKSLIGGGLYGYTNAILKEKGAPILFLSGVSTLAGFIYIVWKHLH